MSPKLNQSEIRSLIEKAGQGDAQAMATLVEENLALVKYVVKRFAAKDREWEDLYQIGCMGLVKAIRNFDTGFPVCFSTYAVPVILGEVRRFLRDDGPVRVSRSIRDNARKICAYSDEYQACTGQAPTLEQTALETGLSREDALLALESLSPARSLSEPIGHEGEMTLGDTLGEDQMEQVDKRLLVQQLLDTLDEQEREVLVRRYFGQETQSQIAARFGMTQVQVSRLEKKLLQRLKEMTREPA